MPPHNSPQDYILKPQMGYTQCSCTHLNTLTHKMKELGRKTLMHNLNTPNNRPKGAKQRESCSLAYHSSGLEVIKRE